MSTSDPFLPLQGEDARPAQLFRPPQDADSDTADTVIGEERRAQHPDPEGDGDGDAGLPPSMPSVFRTPGGDSVDPAEDA